MLPWARRGFMAKKENGRSGKIVQTARAEGRGARRKSEQKKGRQKERSKQERWKRAQNTQVMWRESANGRGRKRTAGRPVEKQATRG